MRKDNIRSCIAEASDSCKVINSGNRANKDRVRPCIVKGKWQPQIDIINGHGFVGASGSCR